MKYYIAAPFFNDEQLAVVEKIKDYLEDKVYFSPKDESKLSEGDTPAEILQKNVNAIDSCDTVIVVTDGKDIGTIWEAGYAYAKQKDIIYVWLTHQPGQKFNIMLAESGVAICTTWDALADAIAGRQVNGPEYAPE